MFLSSQIDPRYPTKITWDGVVQLLADLGLRADNILVLIIAWKCDAETQCEFSEEEFTQGMYRLG